MPIAQQLEDFLATFHHDCAVLSDELITARQIAHTAQPAAALNMVTNHAIYTYETVSLFRQRWRQYHSDNEVMYAGNPALLEQHQEEQGDRLMHATTSMFVASMSAFEFGLRVFMPTVERAWNQIPDRKRPRPYLNDFVKAALAVELIDADHRAHWRSLIDLRNILVHNNGNADEDIAVELPGMPPLSAKAGEMTRGNVLTFAEYTRFATWLFADFANRLLDEAGVGLVEQGP
ncbi:hypothetical protein A7J71_17765 [Achromobacter insolitus]|uniref:hypothetical protein n=1 Tax=Achromobacter insolitus TaxID=217204 RepID=UPI0007CF3F99|nr:hypothetical protein [Achromobacter insolitus]OAE52821.1 hypothetical protein A7J71_17765 [Achromobacter insolitus]OCZ50693.1 hypothetical protein A7P22_15570 [Achromobacter insolitus]